MEAENGDLVPGESHAWQLKTTQSGYPGSAYLQSLPDLDTLYPTTEITAAPALRYPIAFTTPGTYTLWLRGYTPNGAGDSLYIALDNQPAMILTGFAPRMWHWANQNTQGGAVTIEVTEVGLHTLRLWQREDGLRLDRLLLTTAGGYIPTGDGPPESSISNRLW